YYRRIHALTIDRKPLAAPSHERPMIGRRVEILWRTAVAVGRDQVRVLRARQPAPERDQILEHVMQARLALRGDPPRPERPPPVGPPDPELKHLERRVAAHDGVEHHVEEL